MILVTGATGNVGSEVVSELSGRGAPVLALVRDPDGHELPAGVEGVAGDLEKPGTLGGALEGVDAVFLLPGYPGVAEAIAAAGVERVVLLSGGSAGSGDLSNAVTRYMVESEQEVRAAGVAWTILRPSAFMANALRWRDQVRAGDVVRVPFANVRTACVDPRDVAAVAAVPLVDGGHEGEVHWPTGPEALLPEEQVATLAQALGRELRFEAQPDDEARTEMLKSTPVELVDAFFDFYVAGSLDESAVRTTVQDVAGRPPRTFAQWATAHAPDFADRQSRAAR